jgi:hypothetical protein
MEVVRKEDGTVDVRCALKLRQMAKSDLVITAAALVKQADWLLQEVMRGRIRQDGAAEFKRAEEEFRDGAAGDGQEQT